MITLKASAAQRAELSIDGARCLQRRTSVNIKGLAGLVVVYLFIVLLPTRLGLDKFSMRSLVGNHYSISASYSLTHRQPFWVS
jgi:hypothetical protein